MNNQTISSLLGGCFHALRVVVNLLIVIVLGIIVGVGALTVGQYAYWGLWSPIKSNVQAIHQLQDSRDQTQQAVESLRLQQESLTRQVKMLSTEREQQLKQLQAAQSEQVARLKEIENQVTALRKETHQLKEVVTARKKLLEQIMNQSIRNTEELSATQRSLAGGQTETNTLRKEVDTLQQAFVDSQTELEDLWLRVLLLRAQGEALQARIHLMRSNTESADRDLKLIAATLQQALDTAPQEQRAAVVALQDRVTTAQTDLVDDPLAVPEEVDALCRAIGTLISK